MNSTVPAPTYPTAFAAATALSQRSLRISAEIPGAGACKTNKSLGRVRKRVTHLFYDLLVPSLDRSQYANSRRRCSRLTWTEQSRSHKLTALPNESPNTWTSICLGFWMYFSTRTLSSPKDFKASRRADSNASRNEASSCTIRMPFPPPPSIALMRTGNCIFLASSSKNSVSWFFPWYPGTQGTEAAGKNEQLFTSIMTWTYRAWCPWIH